jgi:4-amino-4-deoxy-L-arabinose transferase-like glycosyltransferase
MNPMECPATRPSHPPSADPVSRQKLLISASLATLLACLVLLPLLGHKPLAEWDEGIYAEASREMLSGNWLVPSWNYQVWLEKPPLMLWITAIFFKIFGVYEFWARAGSALSGVAIVGLLHRWLAGKKDLLTAWLSTLILLGTLGFLHVCHMGEMDVLLSLGCCIALIGLTEVDERNLNGWYLFWGGFTIAVMTKGAASVVLVLTAVIFAALRRWQPRRFGKACSLGFGLFLLLVLPWHLYMFHLFGNQFLAEYLGLHVLSRATHQIEGHITHWWYYFGVLLASSAPFVLLYPASVVESFRRAELRAWAVFSLVVVGFFTLVQTRLPHYIAPVYPALAALTAVYVGNQLRPFVAQRRSQSFWIKVALASLCIFITGVLLTGPARKRLHSAKLYDGTILPDNKDSILLLRDAFSHPQPIAGPLLLWREGRIMSIATDVFYSRRQVQQVQLLPIPSDIPTDKYYFQPEQLSEAVTSEPRLILLDKSLVQQIPREFLYTPIQSGKTVELGSMVRTQ